MTPYAQKCLSHCLLMADGDELEYNIDEAEGVVNIIRKVVDKYAFIDEYADRRVVDTKLYTERGLERFFEWFGE